MPPIIEIQNLVKTYPGVRAVDDVSLAIRPGICFGLLGPNGAGKTTLIEIVEGILKPDAGVTLYKGTPVGARFLVPIALLAYVAPFVVAPEVVGRVLRRRPPHDPPAEPRPPMKNVTPPNDPGAPH